MFQGHKKRNPNLCLGLEKLRLNLKENQANGNSKLNKMELCPKDQTFKHNFQSAITEIFVLHLAQIDENLLPCDQKSWSHADIEKKLMVTKGKGWGG